MQTHPGYRILSSRRRYGIPPPGGSLGALAGLHAAFLPVPSCLVPFFLLLIIIMLIRFVFSHFGMIKFSIVTRAVELNEEGILYLLKQNGLFPIITLRRNGRCSHFFARRKKRKGKKLFASSLHFCHLLTTCPLLSFQLTNISISFSSHRLAGKDIRLQLPYQ